VTNRERLFFWSVLILLVIVWLFTPAMMWWVFRVFPLESRLENYAYFGDMYGAVSTLFSAFALGGAIYAVILQSRELQETRSELARSAKAQQNIAEMQALIAMIEFKEINAKQMMELEEDIRRRPKDFGDKFEIFTRTFTQMWLESMTDKQEYLKRLEELLSEVSGRPQPSYELRQKHHAEVKDLLRAVQSMHHEANQP
jgi:hypothetical protein